MDRHQAEQFLHYKYPAVVDLALSMVNLTADEEAALRSCGMRGKTQAVYAEESGFAENTIQRRYSRGIEKAADMWTGCEWVETLMRSMQSPKTKYLN